MWDFSFEPISRQEGSTFLVVDADEESVELRLSEAKLLREIDENDPSSRRQFSLIFVGPSQPLLSQRTYRFRHAELGEFDMFIVPIRQDDASSEYQAVFA